jgi:hypothetical protein
MQQFWREIGSDHAIAVLLVEIYRRLRNIVFLVLYLHSSIARFVHPVIDPDWPFVSSFVLSF